MLEHRHNATLAATISREPRGARIILVSSRDNKSFSRSDVCAEEEELDKSLYIYNIYGIEDQSIKDFLERTHTEIKVFRGFTVPPTAWEKFKEWVCRTDPQSNASEKLREFIIRFVVHAMKGRHQPPLTQFFINKPKQVNIAKNQVLGPSRFDKRVPPLTKEQLESMPTEELEKRHDLATRSNRYGRALVLGAELKRRGKVAR